MTRTVLLSALVLVGIGSVAWSQAAQQGATPGAPNPANFTGKVTNHSTADIRTLRYSFEPGARTNWHSHEGGQVILIEEGHMLVQEEGGAIKKYGPREAFTTAAGVRHWHGSVPGEPLKQVAMSFGTTNWMEKVTDAQYSSSPRK